MSDSEPQRLVAAWREQIDRLLGPCVADRTDIPAPLREAMTHPLVAGGKRLRPLLVLAACRACGGTDAQALAPALAVEMIHTYSLVHDDLPAMDDDSLRRGKPTTHVVYGEAMAVLAGDALHTLAFETLSAADLPPERIARLVLTLARAAGGAGMAGGQALDLEAEGSTAVGEEQVAAIHRLKTGALLAASHRLGAEAAGATADLATEMEAIGAVIGLAFQIQDDVLDVTASTEELGKTAGKDAAVGKATWTAAVGLEEARRRARELMHQALARIDALPGATAPLTLLARLAIDRSK
ncbi:MAG: polyprenyl synthetase family protein [Acidobacteriota bacterium]|nr:polyprenyl synthetase family protein [Acidobacteriota bacterium]